MHKQGVSIHIVILACILAFVMSTPLPVFSQDYKDDVGVCYFDRGLVWETITGLAGTSYDSYVRRDHGLDYPGFEPDIVQAENVGTWATHVHSVGFGASANRVPVWPAPAGPTEYQFGLIAIGAAAAMSTNASDTTLQSIFMKAKHRWKNGENYALRTDPLEAEEVVDINYTYNTNYKFPITYTPDDKHHMPMRIERAIRQWAGSKQNQYWLIYDYKFTNISDHPSFLGPEWEGQGQITLYDFYFLFSFPCRINYRSCRFIGQAESRDDDSEFDEANNMIIQVDGDYKQGTSPENDVFDLYKEGGPAKTGEYLAPAHVGASLLYSTPNRFGESTKIQGYWYSRYANIGLGTETPTAQGASYLIVPLHGTYNPLLMLDSDWGIEGYHTLIGTGVWDIAPGESVRIVFFVGIGSVDLETCYGPNASVAKIATGLDSLKRNVQTAQLATNMALVDGYASSPQYKGWNIPDPPALPRTFTIAPYYGEVSGNVISWDNSAESVADPDYSGAEALDLAGYTVWRSDWLPFEGWRPIVTFAKGDANYYSAATGKYTFVDKGREGDPNSVKVGFTYYYAISSYDTGHPTWPPRPEAFPGNVPRLQSNLMASLNYSFDKTKWKPFRTQRAPGQRMADIYVVPNPFVMQAGFTTPRETDTIQFVNIPPKCTIRIYSVRGDLVRQLEHTDGTGTEVWNQRTLGEQFAESGLYIYRVESKDGATKGQTFIDKFVIIR